LASKDSNYLSINQDELEITKTAIANLAQLEQALLLIELQRQQIAEIKQRAIAIKARTNLGGLLVEDLTKAEAITPPDAVEEIEQTIERSQAVLDSELK
jgi:hypothetical protein